MPRRARQTVSDAAGVCPVSSPEPGTLRSNWFALWVYANREYKVRDALEAKGVVSFLPAWSEEVKWSDRTKQVTRPLILGYIFARVTRSRIPDLLRISGVIEVLPKSLTPIAIADEEIDALRRLTEAGKPVPCEFQAGETVTIDSGAYAGITGIVVRTKGARRLVVGITMLNRAASVELDADTVVRTRTNEPQPARNVR